MLNYQSSNDHKSEKMGLHIGCRVHFDEEAEDYLAETDPVPDKGVNHSASGDGSLHASKRRQVLRIIW